MLSGTVQNRLQGSLLPLKRGFWPIRNASDEPTQAQMGQTELAVLEKRRRPLWKDGLRRELTPWSGASGCSAPNGEVAGLKRRCQYDEHSSSYALSDALGYWPSKQIHSQRTIAFYAPGESPSPEGVISGVETVKVDVQGVQGARFEARGLHTAQNVRAPYRDTSLLQEASVNRNTSDPRTTHLTAPREPLQSPQLMHQPEDALHETQKAMLVVDSALEVTAGMAVSAFGVSALAQDENGAARSVVSEEEKNKDVPCSLSEMNAALESGTAPAARQDLARRRDNQSTSEAHCADLDSLASQHAAGITGRTSGARASASLSVLGLNAPKVVSGAEDHRRAAERSAVSKEKGRDVVPDAPRATFRSSVRVQGGAPGGFQRLSTAECASQARPRSPASPLGVDAPASGSRAPNGEEPVPNAVRRSPPSSSNSVPLDASSASRGASVVAGRVRGKTKVLRGFLVREKRRAVKQQAAAVAAPVAPQLEQKAPGDLLSNSRLRASKPDVESRETCQMGEIFSLTREHDEESEPRGVEVSGESRWRTADSPRIEECRRESKAERPRSPSASSDASEDESDDPLWGKEAVRRRESLNSRILPDLRAHRMSWLLETELQDCGCSSDFVGGLTCWYHLLAEVDGLRAATSLEKVVSEVEAKKKDILGFLGCDCYEAIQDQALSWRAQLEAGTLCEDPYLHSSESNTWLEEHYAQYNLCHETRKTIIRRHDNAVLVDEADECRKWTEEEVESWPILLWVSDGVPLREAPGMPNVKRVGLPSVNSVLVADAPGADTRELAPSRYRDNVVLAEDAADRIRAALVMRKAPVVSQHPLRRLLEQEVPINSPRKPFLWSSLLEEMGVLGAVGRPEALLQKLEEDQDWVTDVVGLQSYEQMREKVASLVQDVEQESQDGVLNDRAPVAKARKSVRFLEGDVMPSTRKNEADPLRPLT
ncbi:hypothetical protein BD626DRAFT_535172 [Schizophyllum amplum]|uniref:Uncharacterized protein n=1 Tax=Schizophyllum amplum TaxID=97359 RepID=A0A550CR30_9AGAR|nr:hypothetical protein BD626DRAFT_535172 [Auriculariopsis ampla]